ncbi:MAG TPA: DeoR/GlpR family DNA-binding transcription regulator [Vicinamibacteria bacterium]|nr:DeoR/GlpR family DNA-binding transcription regulator [Vicinamibacteria bacterium]
MKAAERRLELRGIFERQEFADLAALRKRVRASESTLRRDLMALELEGVLKRVHGGALASPEREQPYDFNWQSGRMAEAKARIARAAAALVEDGQVVILDGGSTVAAVARELASRSLHVLTNSLPIAELLQHARQVELTLTGGTFDPRLGALLGPLAEHSLGAVAADVLVAGTGGVTESGFTNNNALVVGSERKMIEVARRVVIVADHTKFGRAAMFPLAPLDAAHVVVSDAGLDSRYEDMLRARGIRLILA